MISFAESTSIFVVGGENKGMLRSAEAIGVQNCSIPWLHFAEVGGRPSVILTNQNEILTCGGLGNNIKHCMVLKQQKWFLHSNLQEKRNAASSVTMPDGVYIFGGTRNPKTSEFLPNESNSWQIGPEIPNGHERGCAIKISDFEVILIGGYFGLDGKNLDRIIKLDANTNEWTDLGKLQIGRYSHACAVFDNQIIVSGGQTSYGNYLNSSEIISIGNVTSSRLSGSLNEARGSHGMAIADVNDESTLLAFGGNFYQDLDNQREYLRSIEKWNSDSESWTLLTEDKLDEPKSSFGSVSVPSRLLCQ